MTAVHILQVGVCSVVTLAITMLLSGCAVRDGPSLEPTDAPVEAPIGNSTDPERNYSVWEPTSAPTDAPQSRSVDLLNGSAPCLDDSGQVNETCMGRLSSAMNMSMSLSAQLASKYSACKESGDESDDLGVCKDFVQTLNTSRARFEIAEFDQPGNSSLRGFVAPAQPGNSSSRRLRFVWKSRVVPVTQYVWNIPSQSVLSTKPYGCYVDENAKVHIRGSPAHKAAYLTRIELRTDCPSLDGSTIGAFWYQVPWKLSYRGCTVREIVFIGRDRYLNFGVEKELFRFWPILGLGGSASTTGWTFVTCTCQSRSTSSWMALTKTHEISGMECTMYRR